MAMSRDEHDTEEVTRRGGEVYERIVRPKVAGEAGGAKDGRFVALDVESGDYEVADEALSATVRLRRALSCPKATMHKSSKDGAVCSTPRMRKAPGRRSSARRSIPTPWKT